MSETLEQLKEQINQAHGLHARIIAEGIDQVRLIGQMLVNAKSLVPCGTWGTWMADNLSFSADSARLYMRVFKEWDRIVAATPENGKLNYLRARETLGNKQPYKSVRSAEDNDYSGNEAHGSVVAKQHDWKSALVESSDGELIETLVDIVSKRDNQDWIIERVKIGLKRKQAKLSFVET